MIGLYGTILEIISGIWLLSILFGFVKFETALYGGIVNIPIYVDLFNTHYFLKEYAPLKRVCCSLSELTNFTIFQVVILYIISPFREGLIGVEMLLFFCGVHQIIIPFVVCERLSKYSFLTMLCCGIATIIVSVLYMMDIVAYSPYMIVPFLVYSTHLANTMSFDTVVEFYSEI